MVRLAVIGAGELGSRHLQALGLLDRDAEVFVADPKPKALDRAKARFDDVEGRNSKVVATYETDVAALPSELDVAIVATTADVRLDALTKLLSISQVEHVVLEKVLFQRIQDYGEARRTLEGSGTRGWVNCPCRVWPHYVSLKRALSGRKIVSLDLSGSNWGLACNSIHMLDLVEFFNGPSDLALDITRLDPDPMPAKRSGFLEVTGVLTGRFEDGCAVRLESSRQGYRPCIVTIKANGADYKFDEASGRMWTGSTGGQSREQAIDVPYQSRLTQLVVQDLLDTGRCGLTPFAESARLHVVLVSALLGHFRQRAGYEEAERCPIT